MSAQYLTILGTPRSKKNSRRLLWRTYGRNKQGSPVSLPSKAYAAWEESALRQVKAAKLKSYGDKPVEVEVQVIYSGPEPDLGNSCEGLFDVLQQAGVYDNDRQIRSAFLEKRRSKPGDPPRIAIRLEEYTKPWLRKEEMPNA